LDGIVNIIVEPKIRFRFWGKPSRRPKDKAAGDFATQPYSTCKVRSKISENTVFRDAWAVLNPVHAGFEKEKALAFPERL
jgi:hypothetical protein